MNVGIIPPPKNIVIKKIILKIFLPTNSFLDSGYAANNVTKTEITVNASEYRKEFKKPRQIISFSNTLRYASNVQSLILKLNPWLFKTVGSIKDASTT